MSQSLDSCSFVFVRVHAYSIRCNRVSFDVIVSQIMSHSLYDISHIIYVIAVVKGLKVLKVF